MSQAHRVIVIGGGLAGMAAAVALESAGAQVTLLESRKRLGGRAGSFQDPLSGEELDNCQHVLLGCCTNLLDFYNRLGAAGRIEWHRSINYRDQNGRRFSLWGLRGLPAPLHLGPSMALFGALTIRERFAVVRAMLAMLRADPRQLADVPFGQWLDEHGQSDAVIEKFYDPILISALNETSRQAAGSYAMQVFQTAMMNHSGGYVMGLPNCPLSKLYEHIPCRDVRLGQRVAGLQFAGRRVSGVELVDGQVLSADAYVLATHFQTALKWIPPELASEDSRFAHLDRLECVPILGAHLWFDRPVLPDSHAALFHGPLQWLFRKDRDGRSIHGVISAARDWINRPKDECLALFEAQVRQMLPEAKDAKLLRGVVVVEKRATFSPAPGSDRFRPPQAPPAGGIDNLFLAGDYTQTNWPATMEGAVRGGYLAAEAAAHHLPHHSFLVADLPTQWPTRLMRWLPPQPK